MMQPYQDNSHQSDPKPKDLIEGSQNPNLAPDLAGMTEEDLEQFRQQILSMCIDAVAEQMPEDHPDFPLEDRDQKLSRIRSDIEKGFSEYGQAVQSGIEQFRMWDVSGKSGEILDTLAGHIQEGRFTELEAELEKNENFEHLLQQVMDAKKDAESQPQKDFNSVKEMLSTLLLYYPLRVQPYILYVSILQIEQSPQAAAQVYDALIQTMEDPLLYACAAECYHLAGNPYQANEVLDKAEAMIEGNEDEQSVSLRTAFGKLREKFHARH